MAISYYDDAIIAKLKKWIPDNANLRVLTPEDTKRFFETTADDKNDQAFTLPMIALSRSKDIEIERNIKNVKSFDGSHYSVHDVRDATVQINVIPIKVSYQLDIYTKTQAEADEYVRNFLFKLINNPLLVIEIPYNGVDYKHTANLRVLETVSDTSDIAERIFPGQFTRWTIQLELQDGMLFSCPYRKNWRIVFAELGITENLGDSLEADEVEVVDSAVYEIK